MASVKAELSADGDRVKVTFDYSPINVKKVKKVPSATFRGANKGGPMWLINLDINLMRRLREQFGDDLELGPKLKKWGQAETAKERNLTELSQADDAKLDKVPARMVRGCKQDGQTFKLRPYQKADVKFMSNTNVINANQPGAGKTIETIVAVFEAGLEWGQHVVFAPVAALRNVWEIEIKHAYACAGYDEPTILTGDNPEQRREAVAEAKALADDDKAFWLVINPAMARMKRVRKGEGDSMVFEEELVTPELTEVEWDTMTIDEFHLMGLSNPTTMTARGINQIAEETQPGRKYALSGTPMGGKPIKLWGALHFLNPAEFTSRWNWARQWLVINTANHPGGTHSNIEGIMPGREVEFYNHLKPYLVRRTKREALPGLPPKQRISVWCSMTPKQNDQYTTFALEAEWRIDDAEEEGRLSATNVLAEYTRLKQFAGAFCEVHKTGRESAHGIPELRVTPTRDSGKLEQLMEKLAEENVLAAGEDDDEPKCALIFSQFNAMSDMIADTLQDKGVPVAMIKSGKDKVNQEVARSFQEQGEGAPRVIIMNTMMGAALNLSQADSVHLLDETWVPDNQEQAEDRAHRGDEKTMAKDEVRVYYYRTRGSIEEYIKSLVAGKAMNNRTILDLRRRMQKDLEKAEKAAAAKK